MENIEYFKKEFPVTENSILAKKYMVAESTIRVWASKLKLKKQSCSWSRRHERYILNNYEKKSVKEICEKLARSKFAVINKYRELAGLRNKKA